MLRPRSATLTMLTPYSERTIFSASNRSFLHPRIYLEISNSLFFGLFQGKVVGRFSLVSQVSVSTDSSLQKIEGEQSLVPNLTMSKSIALVLFSLLLVSSFASQRRFSLQNVRRHPEALATACAFVGSEPNFPVFTKNNTFRPILYPMTGHWFACFPSPLHNLAILSSLFTFFSGIYNNNKSTIV